jgi:hypothetical protein
VWIAGQGDYWSRWDGAMLHDRPAGGLNGIGLWGLGDDDLWAIDNEFFTIYGNVGHMDPATSTNAMYSLTSSTTSSPPNLTGIWAADDAHVWVVGSAGFLSFFDGMSWTAQASGTSQDLSRIWGASSSDVWAVGGAGTLLHFGGSGWSAVPVPTQANLVAVWGSDSCHVWAVGEGGTILARP